MEISAMRSMNVSEDPCSLGSEIKTVGCPEALSGHLCGDQRSQPSLILQLTDRIEIDSLGEIIDDEIEGLGLIIVGGRNVVGDEVGLR